jgi:lysophospholipase L1-like esterase
MRARFPVGGGGGGGGAGGATWQTYAYADSTAEDLKTLLSAVSATGDDGEGIEFTVADAVAATTVGAMAYIEWPMLDLFGAAAAASSAELVRAVVQMLDGTIPEGLRIGVAVTVGPIASATVGLAVGLQHHAPNDSIYAWESRLASTWAAINTAPIPDNQARGCVLAASRDESTNRAKVSAIPFDFDGYESSIAGGTTSVPSTNADADGDYTHISLLVGTSAALAADTVVRACVKSLVANLRDTTGFARKAAPTVVPRLPSDGAYRILVVGHSYVNAFNASSALSGQATSTGLTNSWTIRDDGATITTWPTAGVSPNVGFIGYMLDQFDAVSGNTGGVMVRRAQNGDALGDLAELYFPMMGDAQIADCQAVGVDEFDLVIVYAGTNDAGDAGDTGRYPDRLRRYIEFIRDHSPHAVIIVPMEEPDSGTFTLIATIEAAKATVCAEYEHVYHLTSVAGYGQLDSSGHPSDAGHSTIADEIVNLILGL